MMVNGQMLVAAVSDKTRREFFPAEKSKVMLKTYTDEPMKVMGVLRVQARYGNQKAKLALIVVDGSGPNLFGRNYLAVTG